MAAWGYELYLPVLKVSLTSEVGLNGSCSSWAAPCRKWLLISHFRAKWIRIPA